MFKFILLVCALNLYSVVNAQITVTNVDTPQELVENVLLGPGVVASNFSFNGVPADASIIQQAMGLFNANGTAWPIASGVVMSSGFVSTIPGSGSLFSGNTTSTGSDPDLAMIEPAGINDACVIEFDFIPSGDTLSFQYMFGSEEYPEFVNSGFNDAFGFFISGPGISGPFSNNSMNIALIPGTGTPVTIDNVNAGMNSQYYVDNSGDVYGVTVQFDAFTVVLTASASVQCGQTYHIKLAIGDAGDSAYDSAVFLAAGSFSSNVVSVAVATVTGDTTVVEGCTDASFIFSRPESDTLDTLIINYDLFGSATQGIDFGSLPNPVIFLPGEDTIIFDLSPFEDNLAEGDEYITIMAYTVNECGDTITSEGTLWIKDAPIALFTPTLTSGCAPIEIMFSNQSLNADDYIWNFGGNTLTVSDLGTYGDTLYGGLTSVSLIASDYLGCSDTISTDIYLDVCGCTDIDAENYNAGATLDDGSCTFLYPSVDPPNVFTPNVDGNNDLFQLNATNALTIDLTITNRWGQIMFQESGVDPKWHGVTNGKESDEGVYFYRYKVTGKKGDPLEGQGFFHLIR